MKYIPLFRDEGEIVATWGEANLIKYLDGRSELRGGSPKDRAEAKEWISLYWHRALVPHEDTHRKR